MLMHDFSRQQRIVFFTWLTFSKFPLSISYTKWWQNASDFYDRLGVPQVCVRRKPIFPSLPFRDSQLKFSYQVRSSEKPLVHVLVGRTRQHSAYNTQLYLLLSVNFHHTYHIIMKYFKHLKESLSYALNF